VARKEQKKTFFFLCPPAAKNARAPRAPCPFLPPPSIDLIGFYGAAAIPPLPNGAPRGAFFFFFLTCPGQKSPTIGRAPFWVPACGFPPQSSASPVPPPLIPEAPFFGPGGICPPRPGGKNCFFAPFPHVTTTRRFLISGPKKSPRLPWLSFPEPIPPPQVFLRAPRRGGKYFPKGRYCHRSPPSPYHGSPPSAMIFFPDYGSPIPVSRGPTATRRHLLPRNAKKGGWRVTGATPRREKKENNYPLRHSWPRVCDG